MSKDCIQGFKTTQEKNATEEIKDSLLTFGEDVIATKFPNYMDGLKNVTRRIVWFSQFDKELIGMINFIGNIMDTHTSGDSSIYGAIIRLSQPWMLGHPLVEVQGNIGHYHDPGDSAAPRYLKARLSDFARDIFFSGIHPKTIPMVPMKDFGGMEPRYLIPKLPTALIFDNLTVGFGYKSYVPMIDFTDVCQLVQIFAEYYHKGGVGVPPRRLTAPHVVPSFPIVNLIKNKIQLIDLYNQGCYTAPVDLEGYLELTGNTITLRAVPYGVDFNTSITKFRDTLKDRKHPLWDEIVGANQYSADDAEFVIEMKRGHSPFNILDKIKSMLYFNKKWTPIYNYMRDDRVCQLNPISLIDLWYRERAIALAGSLKYKQTDLINRQLTLEAMLMIADHKEEVVKLISESENDNDAVAKLYARFTELTQKQARILANQKLTVLTRCNKNQILVELEQVKIDLQNILSDFGRINETIANDAKLLQKKYSSTSKTLAANEFRGYVQIEKQGIIQFFNEDDLATILNIRNWPGDPARKIYTYKTRIPLLWMRKGNNTVAITSNTKEIACDSIKEVPAKKLPYTALFSNGQMCLTTADVYTDPDGWNVCAVTPAFFIVQRDGNIFRDHADNYNVFKSICSGVKSKGIYAVPDDQVYYTFYMCSGMPNMLRVFKTPGAVEAVMPPVGDVVFLGTFAEDEDPIYLNIPKSCIKGNNIQFIQVSGLRNINTKDNGAVFDLNKMKKSQRDDGVKTLYKLAF